MPFTLVGTRWKLWRPVRFRAFKGIEPLRVYGVPTNMAINSLQSLLDMAKKSKNQRVAVAGFDEESKQAIEKSCK